MMDELDAHHFPDHEFQKKTGMTNKESNLTVMNPPNVVDVTPKWLTQTHIDYLVSKQELYGEDAVLTETMKLLLAKLLTTKLWDSKYVLCPSGCSHAFEGRANAATNAIVQVQSRQQVKDGPADPDVLVPAPMPRLTLEGWRLSSTTLFSLLPHMDMRVK